MLVLVTFCNNRCAIVPDRCFEVESSGVALYLVKEGITVQCFIIMVRPSTHALRCFHLAAGPPGTPPFEEDSELKPRG